MKLFQSIRNHASVLGIWQPQPNVSIFNLRNSFILFAYILFLTLTSKFFISEAQTFKEYTDCFYVIATCALKITCFTVTLWKISNIFQLMENFENVVQERKILLGLKNIEIAQGKFYSIKNISFHRSNELISKNYL